MDSRYRAKLPIILTTNLSMTEMKESADIRYTRIYDRIFEMCYPMQFTGRSWRKAEAARRFDEMKNFLEGNDLKKEESKWKNGNGFLAMT